MWSPLDLLLAIASGRADELGAAFVEELDVVALVVE
jgi:hypothetical protein